MLVGTNIFFFNFLLFINFQNSKIIESYCNFNLKLECALFKNYVDELTFLLVVDDIS